MVSAQVKNQLPQLELTRQDDRDAVFLDGGCSAPPPPPTLRGTTPENGRSTARAVRASRPPPSTTRPAS